MKESHKVTIALSIAGFFIIVAWKNIYSGSCSVLAFPLVIMTVIGISIMELSVKKRECLARSYFVEGSFPYRLINSKKLIFIKSFSLSVLLGTSLVIASVTWDFKTFTVLFVDIFLLYWIYAKTLGVLMGNIKEPVKFVIAKDISVSVNSFILMALLLLIQFYTPIPSYSDASLKTTLSSAFAVFSSECSITNFLLKVNVQKDAFSWWAMLSVNSHIHDQNLKLIAWLAFLLSNGLAAYAFSRYMMQLIDLLRMFGRKNEEEQKNER